jgi:hypothetical protein
VPDKQKGKQDEALGIRMSERIKNIASKVFGDKVEDWFGSKRKERFIEIGLKL